MSEGIENPNTAGAPAGASAFSGAAAGALPEKVGRLAAQRGFGGLIDVRREISMTSALVMGVGTAVGSGVAMWLLSLVPGATSAFSWVHSVARVFALVFFFAMVWGIIMAVRGLVVGSRACFLFEGGLVAKHRTGPIAVAWPEITALKTVYRRNQGNEGKVAGYRVETPNGTAFAVPLVLVDGRDAFIDRIVGQVRALGRPIE